MSSMYLRDTTMSLMEKLHRESDCSRMTRTDAQCSLGYHLVECKRILMVGGDIDEVRRRSVPSDCDIGVSGDLLGKGCSPSVGVQTKYIIPSNIPTITRVIYGIVRVYM